MKRLAWTTVAVAAASVVAVPCAHAACDNDNQCAGGPARIMVVLDASSNMLNDGNMAANEGASLWDVVRTVAAAPTGDTLYDAPVEPPGPVASQVVHFGVAVFGNDVPDEQRVLVDWAPCSRPRVDWALDPLSSCVAPGCTDPWAGPAIDWTYQRGDLIDPPGFATETHSHMPLCDGNGMACSGSSRFVEPIISDITDNVAPYLIATPYLGGNATEFVNILLIAGEYDDADDTLVQVAFEQAWGEGITTYVVGIGDAAANPTAGFEGQLMNMADWGSNGQQAHRLAPNSGQLDTVLQEIIAGHDLPCCASIDCSHVGGADGGGGVDGTADGGAADWGGLDGTADGGGADASASASASASGTAGSSNTDTETGGALDDDGGCTCRSNGRRAAPAAWLLVVLAAAHRRRRRVASRDPVAL